MDRTHKEKVWRYIIVENLRIRTTGNTKGNTQKERLRKSKVGSIHATTACMGSRGIDPFFLKPQH